MGGPLTRVLQPCMDTLQVQGATVHCTAGRDHEGAHVGAVDDLGVSWLRAGELRG